MFWLTAFTPPPNLLCRPCLYALRTLAPLCGTPVGGQVISSLAAASASRRGLAPFDSRGMFKMSKLYPLDL